jgi:predicted unusual protein kinase regulating ubiquinone biosynthesis (AarF/ABC1/UbiB family)
MCEGVAATLDPSFRMMAVFAPYVQRMTGDQRADSPERIEPG